MFTSSFAYIFHGAVQQEGGIINVENMWGWRSVVESFAGIALLLKFFKDEVNDNEDQGVEKKAVDEPVEM
jgi:hypothetical protein